MVSMHKLHWTQLVSCFAQNQKTGYNSLVTSKVPLCRNPSLQIFCNHRCLYRQCLAWLLSGNEMQGYCKGNCRNHTETKKLEWTCAREVKILLSSTHSVWVTRIGDNLIRAIWPLDLGMLTFSATSTKKQEVGAQPFHVGSRFHRRIVLCGGRGISPPTHPTPHCPTVVLWLIMLWKGKEYPSNLTYFMGQPF